MNREIGSNIFKELEESIPLFITPIGASKRSSLRSLMYRLGQKLSKKISFFQCQESSCQLQIIELCCMAQSLDTAKGLKIVLSQILGLLEIKRVYTAERFLDQYLADELFKYKREGVFVDVGAHDGLTTSNTYFLEQFLGWRGLLIEPQKKAFEKLSLNRKAECLELAIDSKSASQELFTDEAQSSVNASLSYRPDHLQKRVEVITCRLDEVLRERGMRQIDFLKVDAEGLDLEILRSIDFTYSQIDTIMVETIFRDPRFKGFLQEKGYERIKVFEYNHVNQRANEIFKKKSWV